VKQSTSPSMSTTALLATVIALALSALTNVTPASAWSTRSAARELRSCVNHERARYGLPALRPARALARAARSHARSMARAGYFSHTDRRGRGPYQRVSARTSWFRHGVGENIAAGRWTMRRTCSEWMRSAGHRRMILDRGFDHIGAGVARDGRLRRYMVVDFGDAS